MPPLYHNVDAETAEGLKVLRKRIEKSNVPASQLDSSILLATWNIREFGKGKRSAKAIHYIAEILSYFDLIAIQELRANVGDLRRVMDNLGPDWRVVFSDVTLGSRGNEERIAYLYDRRAVTFTGLAAEAVVAPVETKQNGKKVTIPAVQFWRTPYIASFRAGSFDFVLIAVHVLWGKVSQDRVVELGLIADWVEERRTSKFAEDKDIILLGDFNIPKRGDKYYNAITKHGLHVPKSLVQLAQGSNLGGDAYYDQIFYHAQETSKAIDDESGPLRGGNVDFYAKDHKKLFPDLTFDKFTYQLSDHLPLWVELKTDTADEELDQILNPGN